MTDNFNLQELRGDVFIEWKIRNLIFFPQLGRQSPKFKLCDAHWFLECTIRTVTGFSPKEINFILHRKCSSSKTHSVFYKVRILELNNSLFEACEKQHEFSRHADSTIIKKLNWEDISITCLNKEFTVAFSARVCIGPIENARVIDASSQTSLSRSINTLVNNFGDLLRKEHLTDTIMNVQNREFKVHRCVLAARSPVFSAMFDVNMLEKDRGVINIDECDPELFPDFLLFLYTGKTDHITDVNASFLYKIADKYDIKDLREECSNYLSRKLCVNSFCDTVLIAHLYNDPELLKTAADFFVKYVKEILPTTKWHAFLTANPMLANELFIASANNKQI